MPTAELTTGPAACGVEPRVAQKKRMFGMQVELSDMNIDEHEPVPYAFPTHTLSTLTHLLEAKNWAGYRDKLVCSIANLLAWKQQLYQADVDSLNRELRRTRPKIEDFRARLLARYNLNPETNVEKIYDETLQRFPSDLNNVTRLARIENELLKPLAARLNAYRTAADSKGVCPKRGKQQTTAPTTVTIGTITPGESTRAFDGYVWKHTSSRSRRFFDEVDGADADQKRTTTSAKGKSRRCISGSG